MNSLLQNDETGRSWALRRADSWEPSGQRMGGAKQTRSTALGAPAIGAWTRLLESFRMAPAVSAKGRDFSFKLGPSCHLPELVRLAVGISAQRWAMGDGRPVGHWPITLKQITSPRCFLHDPLNINP